MIEIWSAAALGLVLMAAHSETLAAEPRLSKDPNTASKAEEGKEGTEVPIACTLTSKEKHQRKQGVEAELFAGVSRVTELENGYTLWLPRGEGQLSRIARFVELESQCCAFLDFEIRVEAGGESIAVDLTGPEGTKQVLQSLVSTDSSTGDRP